MRMTTRSSVNDMLRTVRRFILGPWPMHTGALWTFLSAMILGVTWRLFGSQPMVPQSTLVSERILPILAVGILSPGVVLVPLIIYRRIRSRFVLRAVTSPEYLLALAGASVIGGALVNVIFRDSVLAQEVLNHPRLLDSSVRIFVPVAVINAVIGTVFARIQKESDTAQEALQTVVAQRRLLLESEERVRGQVASFLHDRVQTDLVTIALRIRATMGQSPEVMTNELTSVITELERVRSKEVRMASRQLSPNLSTVTLDTALRDLAESYRPAMEVLIDVHASVSHRIEQYDDSSRATGIYRICEQGLLNAAVHGLATECSIQLALTAGDELVLHLRDNGIGMQGESVQPGMGMTVMSAWVETLGGQWSLGPSDSGTTLTATIPAHL
jgi:glucose-6-phosphate-specific signal transduction histidine kinase